MKKDAYARAGVDVNRVRKIQDSLAASLAGTFSNRRGRFGTPLMGIGHYAGLIDIGGGRALAMHTDGVGTKVQLAVQMDRYETIGIDCVAMTVNDLICVGAEPVALLDYIALEREDESLVSRIMVGLIEGARRASTAIVGGETAIMGSSVKGFDLVSMGVGVVEAEEGPRRLRHRRRGPRGRRSELGAALERLHPSPVRPAGQTSASGAPRRPRVDPGGRDAGADKYLRQTRP